MSMSDCPKCWDTPCTCGWEYKDWNVAEIIDLFENIMKYHDREEIIEILESSEFIEELTEKDKKDLAADE